MNLLTIENLGKQFSERMLFDNANLMINKGDRVGLIGVNGSGKSTLLRIIAGEEAPDSGSVNIWGNVTVQYLAQEPILDDSLTVLEQIFHSDSPQMKLLRDYQQASQNLERVPDNIDYQTESARLSTEMDQSGGWAAEANAKAVLTRLGIPYFDTQIATLSGGQRKRVALARALIDRADLLILDEPTNHIDAETITWLEDYLATTPGALLMVTHDRYFLDRVVNRITELDRRQLVSYTGNYSHYLEAHADRHEKLAEAEQKRQKFLQRELEWLRRGAMARSTKQKARKQRIAEMMEISYDRGDRQVSMALAGRRLGKIVLIANGLHKVYDSVPVVDTLDFTLEPGDRIGIMGANGAGKSTLLNMLADKITLDGGTMEWGDTVHLAYYDQRSIDLDDKMRLIEFIQREAPVITTNEGERVEADQMLEWFLFPRKMQWGRIGSLSGGERRRLYLLRTLLHQPNVLLLDEPTNDLDVQTLGVLEEYLDHFQGCLIVVSHDRYFLDRTVDYMVRMEDGKLGPRYPTPYSSFIRLENEAKGVIQEAAVAARPANSKAAKPVKNRPRKLSWKEKRELEDLEPRIEELENQKAQLIEQMAASASDYVKMQSLSEQLDKIESETEAAMERWMTLSEIAEN